jgi:protein-tyrosine phosphatase
VTERWIELVGACNVRDLGGLPLRDGGVTRSGVILRADALDGLGSDDVATLTDTFGLRHVIDLRSEGERIERGRGPLGDRDVTYTEVEVVPSDALGARQSAREERYASGDPPDLIMAEGYVHLLEIGAPAFATAVSALVIEGGTPALFHCSAGKDRTGVLAALLLDLAGVEHEAIVADYAQTADRMKAVFGRLRGAEWFARLSDEVPAFVLDAQASTMEKFLATLTERWGDAAGYMQFAGIAPDTVDVARGLLR